ncbi:MAG: 16S rRNA (adenine(1518)-N(6)/adenine(1519)-N(6))-dimethyltransferase RsmA [Ruminococcus sp.]|jgi:16S rRNA (adenine1518-N6/adenine1519-N6)-dimethyltransferase|nr:16S rRNA (adenine(1518)-N(6)/adenine(1519)-N(6))-dimethyltransferase RsmA [Ruminococcus sp.]
MNLTNLSVIKEILSRHEFNFAKKLGQNFLINPSVCPKMADSALLKNSDGKPDTIKNNENNIGDNKPEPDKTNALEIGPGIGVLTQELAKRADKVVSVEIDKKLIPVLNETLSEYNNITVLNADFLTLNLEEIILKYFGKTSIENGEKVAICANLPYYITSPIIMHILESSANKKNMISNITCLVQKEVAERFIKQDSAIALAIHYYGDVKKLFGVKKGSFIPSPKVDSAVIQIDIKNKFKLNQTEEENLFRIIKAAYMQRRKTLSNSLGKLYDKELSNQILEEKFGCVTIRPEELDIEDFIEVSKIYEKENCGYIRRSEL